MLLEACAKSLAKFLMSDPGRPWLTSGSVILQQGSTSEMLKVNGPLLNLCTADPGGKRDVISGARER